MRIPGKAGSEGMPKKPTAALRSTAAACVLSPSRKQQNRENNRKNRRSRGGNHFDKFDKLRR